MGGDVLAPYRSVSFTFAACLNVAEPTLAM